MTSQPFGYPDPAALHGVEQRLRALPPLVAPSELLALRGELAEVSREKRFVLQRGDCAERPSESADGVSDTLRALFKMAVALLWGSFRPVVKIGRIGGQSAKPRSADFETVGEVTLPSYRGEIVNGGEFTEGARVPDPDRMLRGYHHSAATHNMARALCKCGFADLPKARERGDDGLVQQD